MNIKHQQKRAAALGFVTMIVMAAMLSAYIWEVISYERLVAQSPYPLLGRIIVVIRVCINFALILLVYNMQKRIIVSYPVKKYEYLITTGLIIILGIALRLATVQQSVTLVDVTQSIEYQIANVSLNLTDIPPEEGTWLESSMLYLAKYRFNSYYPLHILPLFIRLFGNSSVSVHYSNVLLDVLNMMLLYFCANKRAGEKAGLMAVVLYALWPQKIILCLEASSATFSLTIILVCCALVLSVIEIKAGKAVNGIHGRQLLLPIFLGVFMGLSFFCTTYSVILVPVWLLLLVISPKQDIPITSGTIGFFKTRFILPLFVLLVALLSQFLFTNHMNIETHQSFPNPYEAIGYSLMVGNNYEADGRWNEEDAAILQTAQNAINGQREAWIIAKDRIINMSLEQRSGLVHEKLSYLWRISDSFFLQFDNTQDLSTPFLLTFLSNRYPAMTLTVLCFALLGVYLHWLRQPFFISAEAGTAIVLLLCMYWFMSDTEMYVSFFGIVFLLSAQCLCTPWKPKVAEETKPELFKVDLRPEQTELLDSHLVITATKACRDLDIQERGDMSIFLQAKHHNITVVGEEHDA